MEHKSRFESIFKDMVAVIILVVSFMCVPLHCNAEGYSSIPYMTVRLIYGTQANTFNGSCADYRIEKVELSFKNDGSPAVIDLTSSGRDDKNMKRYGRNYVGGQYFIGDYRESKNLIQNKLKDCLMDVDMDEYLSLDCTKTEIKILPKDAETWNAFEASVGLTEDNYESKQINIYVVDKKYALKPQNVEELDNPTILTTTRKSEKSYSGDTQSDIPALYYKANGVGYYHTVKKEEDNSYDILPEPVINLYWTSASDINHSRTQKLNYLEKPATVSIDMIKDIFYCPGYEVDNIYAKKGDIFTPISIDDTYNSNVDIYPHWRRKKNKSTLQVFSAQDINEIEKSKANIDIDVLSNVINSISNILENDTISNDELSGVSDSVNNLLSKIYDKTITNSLTKSLSIVNSSDDVDTIFMELGNILDELESIKEQQELLKTHSNRYYPRGGGKFYEVEFDSKEGVTLGNELPDLEMSKTKSYKFLGWHIYEWSDDIGKFIQSSDYPELFNPRDMEESLVEGDEEEDDDCTLLKSNVDKDYYAVAEWANANVLHFDTTGITDGEPTDGYVGENIDVYYFTNNETIKDIPIPSRDGYTFDGWYVRRYSNDKVGTKLNIDENGDCLAKDIISAIYGSTSDYTLIARWVVGEDDNDDDADKDDDNKDDDNSTNKNEDEQNPNDLTKEEMAEGYHLVTFVDDIINAPSIYTKKIKTKNKGTWSDIVPPSATSDKYVFKGFRFSEGNGYLDISKEINLSANVTLYAEYDLHTTEDDKIILNFPEYNKSVEVYNYHYLSEYDIPNPTKSGDIFVGWSLFSAPYTSFQDIYMYPNSRISVYKSADLYAVFMSDVSRIVPFTNTKLSMEPIYRSNQFNTAEVCIYDESTECYVTLSSYNSEIEKNADKLISQLVDICSKTDKPYVVICSKGDVHKTKTLKSKCDVLCTDYEDEDFANSIAFMYSKYFKYLGMFFKHTISKQNETELDIYKGEDVDPVDGYNALYVSDFDKTNDVFGDDIIDDNCKIHMFTAIDPKLFLEYYNYCKTTEDSIDMIINNLQLNSNMLVTDAILKVNDYTNDNMAYDNWYEIYDLYWILKETSSERESPTVNRKHHGVCAAYSKLICAIFDKCGFEMIPTGGYNSDGKLVHSYNRCILDNNVYYCDYCWSDKAYPTKFMFLTEDMMRFASHYNSIPDYDKFDYPLKKVTYKTNTAKKTSIKSVTTKKSKTTVNVKKVKDSKVYILQYSLSKKFKNFKEVKSKSNKFTIKNLKKNKKYYFRVRYYSYRYLIKGDVDSKYKKYSGWSKVMSKKIK